MERLEDGGFDDTFEKVKFEFLKELKEYRSTGLTPQEILGGRMLTGWIPVGERLPEAPYGCLVTVIDTEIMTSKEFESILPYHVGYDGDSWNDADGEVIPFEVIAWMLLPEPYRPEAEAKLAEMENADGNN